MTPEDRVAAAIDAVPQLAGAHNVQRLGGLTNVNVKVESSAGTFVVRIDASDGDVLDINRESELANCQAASDAGVGAPFVSWLPAEHVLIMGFLTGRTLTPDDLRRGDRLAEVAALLRRLHSSCRFRGNFDMFRRQRDYQAAALGRGFAVPDGYVRHERDVRRIDRAFAAHPMPPVACHNDLVAENFIDTPQACGWSTTTTRAITIPALTSAMPGLSRIYPSRSSSSSWPATTASPTRRLSRARGSGRSCQSTVGRSGRCCATTSLLTPT